MTDDRKARLKELAKQGEPIKVTDYQAQQHQNTEAGYCETWNSPRTTVPAKVKWPDHDWAGDDDGHNCTACPEDSPWKCDNVAHRLGEAARAIARGEHVQFANGGYTGDEPAKIPPVF